MSLGPTLNSRLRVLVAKAFRAEKLYSSVNSSRAERLTNLAVIAEAASDIRAREWQRTHYQLRTALNDILSIGNSGGIVKEVVGLRETFLKRSQESLSLVEKGAEDLIETTRRQEFAHIFKISAELIRLKAQAQACRAVADELSGVLEATSNGDVRAAVDSDINSRLIRPQHGRPGFEEDDDAAAIEAEIELQPHSNVVQLKQRAGSRKR